MYRILYVDDDPGLLEIGKIFLEQGGEIIVDTLNSAIPALALLDYQQHDAVISDYQMPGMDGIAFLKKVRAAGNNIPFILFTGKGREEVVIQALNEGADFYLQKGGDPVSQFAELSNKVRYAINSKRSAAALGESEEKYRRIVETSIEGIWSMDARFITVFVNRKMADMLGYSVPEMLGKQIMEFMDPSELADNTKKLENRRKGINEFYERKFKRKDGSLRWFGVSVTALKDPAGNFAGSFAMLTDITDRKMAEDTLRQKNDELGAAYEQIAASEEELRVNLDELAANQEKLEKSERKYRDLFDNAILGIFRSTPDGHYLDMNPAFARIAGFASPRTMMETVRDIQQLYTRPEERFRLKEMLAATGEIHNFETEIRRGDGKTIWISINAKTARDTRGNIVRYDGTIEDITSRRKAEMELSRWNEELQASHEEITSTEEALRQKSEELENRNQLISTILDTTPIGIFMVEAPSGKPIMANRKAAQLLGRGIPADATGNTLADIYEAYRMGTNQKYPPGEMPIIRGMRGESSHIDDMEVVRPDGTRVRLEIFGNPVRDFEGRVIASLVSFLDITGRP
jgi:PAS domain S-box-containing protein